MGAILTDFVRFVLFQPLKGDVGRDWRAYLAIGLAITWAVGFGRTWDFDGAPLWLRTGLRSIAYAFLLAGLIWLVGLALKPDRWSYKNVLLMVTMTALPGVVYAIPVERFLAPDTARAVNLLLLLIVATWRMALFRRFLRQVALLPDGATLIVWLLPPTLILAPLSLFGLLDAVMRGMSGVRDEVEPGEVSGEALVFIAGAAWLALPILLVAFVWLAIHRRRAARAEKKL